MCLFVVLGEQWVPLCNTAMHTIAIDVNINNFAFKVFRNLFGLSNDTYLCCRSK